MRWTTGEARRLRPILDRMALDLSRPLDLVVACSGRGELAFELARRFPHARIVGFELDDDALAAARGRAAELGLERSVEFLEARRYDIPLPSGRFGGLVSDFVLYPTSRPTEFGQAEIARVLKPGGVALITDVLVAPTFDPAVRREFELLGLDYVCETSPGDFERWSADAGLEEVLIDDLTPLVRPVWELRKATDPDTTHQPGYSLLLDPATGLGGAVTYVYIRAKKPRVPSAPRVEAAVFS